jgi:hypothetical protein
MQKGETFHVTLVTLGGYENRRTKTEINSETLSPGEAETLRELINKARFFDLPETMTSSKQQCFDCYNYETTVESQGQRHTVYINTERIETPATLRLLLDWLLKRSPRREK